MTRAAGDFFLEGLSTFEMVQRGFSEARQAALLERRQTELSRQLSTFLADASLALDAHDSLQEMLRLVAEQARELVGADCCVATVAVEGEPRIAEAASYPEADRSWQTLRPVARSGRDLPPPAPERRLDEDRGRAARSPASLLHRGRRAAASQGGSPPR